MVQHGPAGCKAVILNRNSRRSPGSCFHLLPSSPSGAGSAPGFVPPAVVRRKTPRRSQPRCKRPCAVKGNGDLPSVAALSTAGRCHATEGARPWSLKVATADTPIARDRSASPLLAVARRSRHRARQKRQHGIDAAEIDEFAAQPEPSRSFGSTSGGGRYGSWPPDGHRQSRLLLRTSAEMSYDRLAAKSFHRSQILSRACSVSSTDHPDSSAWASLASPNAR